MRRPLVWLAAFQALGIVLAERGWLRADAAVVLAAVALALGLVLPRGTRGIAALVVALAAGAISFALRLDDAARGRAGAARSLTLEGRVNAVTRGASSWSVGLDDVAGVGALAPPRVLLSGRRAPAGVVPFEAVVPGERVRARVRLKLPRPLRNPGAPDREARARRAGLGGVGGLAHPSLHARLPQRDAALLAALHRWRAGVAQRLGVSKGGALLRALALGDRADLPAATRDAFARLGVSHLLAVSGLHLAWVAALAYAALRMGPGRLAWLAARADTRRPALAVGLAAATAYALVAGWGVPVRRALVLLGALALAVAAGRSRARAEPLALAALVVLAFEPDALFAPGAQLSFAATIALVFAARREPGGGWLSGLLRTSATALAATAPLAALQFGSRAPLALVVNLVAVPWTGAALLPASLGAAALASLPPSAMTETLLGAARDLAAWTLGVAEAVASRAPGVASGVPPESAWVSAAAALGLGALFAERTAPRVVCAGAMALLLHLAPAARVLPGPPRAVFLDVGQGDAVLVQGLEGALLVDAGVAIEGGPDLGVLAVVPALRALGIARLDLVVASHADLDHRGGLPAVLAAFPVGEAWLPRGGLAEEAFAPLLDTARRGGVPVHERGQGDPTRLFGDLLVSPLWPPAHATGLSRNDRSLVLRVEVGDRRVLLPGDLEAGAESRLVASGADLRADVLKLPHHGSRSSSIEALLAAVGASVSVVSAPCESRFGMPHAEVLARTRAAGHALWWTGRDGAVLVGLAPRLHAASHATPRLCGRRAARRPAPGSAS